MNAILVPTDFSEEATSAFNAACLIAKRCGGKIHLLHVIETPYQSFNVEGEIDHEQGLDVVFVRKLMEKMRNQMQEMADEHPDVEIDHQVKVGHAYKNIVAMVTEYKVNLVVMGTKGASGIQELLVGSNTEKVVRMSQCPVLSLKKDMEEADFNEIAFATDLRDDQHIIVDELKEFQKVFNSKIHLVRVNTPNNFQADRLTFAHMREYAKDNGLDNVSYNVFNDPVEGDGIMFFAQEKQVGMIAIATHGRRGLSHILSGSIAEDIVNHAKRPVLTLNIRGKDDGS